MNKPALSLAAVPGRRKATIALAQEIEKRGYPGVYLPSFGDAMGLAVALALTTERIEFGTSVQPIYLRQPSDFAAQASFIHELSGGRFRFGIGVTHAPVHQGLGVTPGKPLSDIRNFVARFRKAGERGGGEMPPVVLATLRRKMVELSAEIAEGCVWANGARSHIPASLAHLPADKRNDPAFFKIPDQQATIAEYLLLYSMSGEPGDFDPYVDYDYQLAFAKAARTHSCIRR